MKFKFIAILLLVTILLLELIGACRVNEFQGELAVARGTINSIDFCQDRHADQVAQIHDQLTDLFNRASRIEVVSEQTREGVKKLDWLVRLPNECHCECCKPPDAPKLVPWSPPFPGAQPPPPVRSNNPTPTQAPR